MDKGVYIRKSSGWNNANDKLDIRGSYNGNNTINGSPAIATVPKVFARTPDGWDQIYPPKEKQYRKITLNGKLDYYRWRPDLKESAPYYGWKKCGRASQGYYGKDYYDDGINDDMTNTQRRNIGWLGLGSGARSKLPNAESVKKITYLRFDIIRGDGAGHYGELCELSLNLNKIERTSTPTVKSNNPHINNVGEPLVLCKLKPCGNRYSSTTTYTVDLSTSKGKEIAAMVMKWMKGEDGVNSIVSRNKEYSGIRYPGIGLWSDNYTTLKKFAMTISYVAEAN